MSEIYISTVYTSIDFFLNRAINTNLLNFIQFCISIVDNNVQVDIIYTYLKKKTFEVALFSKLHVFDFIDNSLKFVSSIYIRKQFETIAGHSSEESIVTSI